MPCSNWNLGKCPGHAAGVMCGLFGLILRLNLDNSAAEAARILRPALAQTIFVLFSLICAESRNARTKGYLGVASRTLSP